MNSQSIWHERTFIQNYIDSNNITKEEFYKNAWIIFHVMKLFEDYIKSEFNITFEEFWKLEENQYKFYEYTDFEEVE